MADEVVGSATVEIVPDTSGFAGDLRSQFSGIKGKLTGAVAALGLGAALVGGIHESIEQANIKSKLQAQLGSTGKVAAQQGKVAGQLYSTGVVDSFQDAADSIKAVASAGLVPPGATTKQLKEISTSATDVAKVFDQDVGETARAAGQLIKTGLAKNATDAFNILTKGFQSGANAADDLIDTFNEYGTQFRKFGISGQQAIGLINQGLKAGARDADIVADAIKEFSIRITDGSKTTATNFKLLGLSADDMSAKFNKGGSVANAALQLTLDKLKDVPDKAKRSQIAVGLFGTQAEDLGDALYALDPKTATDKLGKFGDAAKKLGDTLRSGPVYQLQTLGRRLKQGFTEAVGTALPTVLTLGQQFVAALLPTNTGLKSRFSEIGRDYKEFFRGLSGEAAKGTVSAGPPSLRGPTEITPSSSAARAGNDVRKAVLELGKNLKPITTLAVDLGKAFYTIVKNIPTEVLVGFATAMVTYKVASTITAVAVAFRGLATAEAAAWIASNRIFIIVGIVSAIAYGLGRLTGAFDSVSGAFKFFGEGIAQIGRGLKTAGLAIWKAEKAVEGFNDAIGDWLINAGRAVGRFLTEVFSIHGAVADFFHDSGVWLVQSGRDIVLGLWKGLKEQGREAKQIGITIKNWVVKGFTSAFGISSPAKVMVPIGMDIVRGVISGMLSVARTITGWLSRNIKSPTVGYFGGASDWLYRRGAALVNGLISGARSVARGIGGWFSRNVRSPITGAFSGASTWLYNRGASVIRGLLSGMKQPYKDLQNWVSGIAGWIKAHKGPVHLDAQLLMPAGRALMGGLLKGLKIGFGPVGSFIYGSGKSVKETVSGIFGNLSGGTSGANQRLGKLMMSQRWSAAQWPALRALWMGESGWNERALNKSSGAYGIPQSLPASKMGSAGSDWRTNPGTQIKWGLNYIASRYGSPGAAYAAWLRRKPHWYDAGGLAQHKGFIPKNTNMPERVLSPTQTAAFERWMDRNPQNAVSGAATGVTVVLVNQGMIGSQRELETWLTNALDNLQRTNRLGTIVKRALQSAGGM
jgi:minor tail protein/transglycosylase-like protein with SLT domain